MTPAEKKPGKNESADQRKARLAAELRANLARRKEQARSRRAGAADERPEGLLRGGGESDKNPGIEVADSQTRKKPVSNG